MKTNRFAALPACRTQAFYGPFRKPSTGRIRSALLALAIGLVGAWLLGRFLCE